MAKTILMIVVLIAVAYFVVRSLISLAMHFLNKIDDEYADLRDLHRRTTEDVADLRYAEKRAAERKKETK